MVADSKGFNNRCFLANLRQQFSMETAKLNSLGVNLGDHWSASLLLLLLFLLLWWCLLWLLWQLLMMFMLLFTLLSQLQTVLHSLDCYR